VSQINLVFNPQRLHRRSPLKRKRHERLIGHRSPHKPNVYQQMMVLEQDCSMTAA
jgi:hypothetical protein